MKLTFILALRKMLRKQTIRSRARRVLFSVELGSRSLLKGSSVLLDLTFPSAFYILAIGTHLAVVSAVIPWMPCVVVSSASSSCTIQSLSQLRAKN